MGILALVHQARRQATHPINARLETVATNGMFRPSFQSKRCVVPMLGYYEWEAREEAGKTVKQPYFIHHGDQAGYLAAAGLWTARKDDSTGEWAITYTIITREARDASGEIHDRMPVFLTADVVDEWLDPGRRTDVDDVLELLRDSSADVAAEIVTHPVDRRVNDVRRADRLDPELTSPIPQ